MKIIFIFLIFLNQININRYANLYFIRHAQGEHNLAALKNGLEEYENPKWFDAVLTDKGIIDSMKIQNKIKNLNPDLIYCSPFRRTIQTMYYSVTNVENIPIIIDDNLRETMNNHPCNYRNNKTEIERYTKNLFGDKYIDYTNVLDFTLNKTVISRGKLWLKNLVAYLKNQPYIKNVLIYTHGGFMKSFLNSYLLRKLNKNIKCFDYPNNLEICKIKYVI